MKFNVIKTALSCLPLLFLDAKCPIKPLKANPFPDDADYTILNVIKFQPTYTYVHPGSTITIHFAVTVRLNKTGGHISPNLKIRDHDYLLNPDDQLGVVFLHKDATSLAPGTITIEEDAVLLCTANTSGGSIKGNMMNAFDDYSTEESPAIFFEAMRQSGNNIVKSIGDDLKITCEEQGERARCDNGLPQTSQYPDDADYSILNLDRIVPADPYVNSGRTIPIHFIITVRLNKTGGKMSPILAIFDHDDLSKNDFMGVAFLTADASHLPPGTHKIEGDAILVCEDDEIKGRMVNAFDATSGDGYAEIFFKAYRQNSKDCIESNGLPITIHCR